ncbi:MAG: 50S ribosomal protein L3 [Nanoarchaeota archaeon]
MAKLSKPREGSLQFAPRNRAEKFLPSVNWSVVLEKSNLDKKLKGLLGFVAYKVGMATALVKDSTDKSMTAGKKVYLPVTILEVPAMKVYSIRFYNEGIVAKESLVSIDKELKKIVRLPKALPTISAPEKYDDVRVIVYTLAKQTNIKKTPDIIEVAIHAPTAHEKFEYAKSLIGKELSLNDFVHSTLLDSRGLTTGHGFTGAVRRFGISLKQHKSEKGRRRPGSLGPWHPARVTFRTPMAGQYGMFARMQYNNVFISSGNISEKDINPKSGFSHYGKITSSYIIIKGSIQGPEKRQILLTPSFRQTKYQLKKKYEFQEIIV